MKKPKWPHALFLSVVGAFKGLSGVLGVDYPKLRALLEVKLVMDTRRTYHNVQVKTDEKTGEMKDSFSKLMTMHFAAGLFLGIFVIEVKSLFMCMLVIQSYVLMMGVMSLMSNLNAQVMDTSDNIILLSRPLDGRTVFMSRVLHIIYYLFSVLMALSITALAVGTWKYGVLFAVAFFITIVFSTLLSVFLVYSFYLSVLKLVGGEKFQDLMTLIQIVLPLAIFALFFLGGDDMQFTDLMVSRGTWVYFVPSAWFAGTVEALVHNMYRPPFTWYMILTVLVPLASMVLAVKVLAPSFNRKLLRMELETEQKEKTGRRYYWSDIFARLFNRGRAQRAIFEMTWKLAGRDRKYKLNTYSLLGTNIFFYYLLVITVNKNFWLGLEALSGTQRFIGFLYLGCLLWMVGLSQLAYSDDYKASWVYRLFPQALPGEMLMGAFKAVLVKLSFPFVFAVVFVLGVWGIAVLDDVVLAFFNILLFCIHLAFIYVRSFPFSLKHSMVSISGKILTSLGALFLYIGVAVGHYFILPYWHAVPAALLPLAALTYYQFRRYRATPWTALVEQ